MSGRRLEHAWRVILLAVAATAVAHPALACSVCLGGDPNSSMNQGVQAGMLVLLGVTGAVLSALAALLTFWARRAAQLRRLAGSSG